MSSAPGFEGWAIVELMGHRKLAGYVSEATIAGGAFIRLDVPSEPPVTQFYGPQALYALTPTTEEMARMISRRAAPRPVERYELALPPNRAHDPDEIDPDEAA